MNKNIETSIKSNCPLLHGALDDVGLFDLSKRDIGKLCDTIRECFEFGFRAKRFTLYMIFLNKGSHILTNADNFTYQNCYSTSMTHFYEYDDQIFVIHAPNIHTIHNICNIDNNDNNDMDKANADILVELSKICTVYDKTDFINDKYKSYVMEIKGLRDVRVLLKHLKMDVDKIICQIIDHTLVPQKKATDFTGHFRGPNPIHTIQLDDYPINLQPDTSHNKDTSSCAVS